MRFSAGWVFCGICVLLVIINLSIVVITVVKGSIMKYKKKRWLKHHGLKELPESVFKPEPVKEIEADEVVFNEPDETIIPKVSF